MKTPTFKEEVKATEKVEMASDREGTTTMVEAGVAAETQAMTVVRQAMTMKTGGKGVVAPTDEVATMTGTEGIEEIEEIEETDQITVVADQVAPSTEVTREKSDQ